MKTDSIYLFLLFLFVTLQSIYFRQISLAPFPMLGFLMGVFAIFSKTRINQKDILLLLGFYSIIFISILIGFLGAEYNNVVFYAPRLIGWLLFPISIVVFKKLFNIYTIDKLFKIINWVILFHAGLFIIQFIYFKLTGDRIDFLEPITGEKQRIGASKLKEFGSSNIRASGIYSEPGSYTIYIYILTVIAFDLKKKLTPIMIVGLATMFLSFSMTGIFLAIFFVAIYIYLNPLTKKQIFNMILMLFLVGMLIIYNREIFLGPILNRMANISDDGSSTARFASGIEQFIFDGKLFIGYGIGFLSKDVKATSILIGGMFELGLVILTTYLIYIFGVILKAKKKFYYVILFLPVLFSNLYLTQIIFCFFTGYMFYSKKVKESIIAK